MSDEALLGGLIELAQRTGVSIEEIHYLVRRVVQIDCDPLPLSEQGDRFDFARLQVSAIDDPYDFYCFNPKVPKPDAQVDLPKAWEKFKSDVTNINHIFSDYPDLPIAKYWQLFLNGWDWFRFWSVRHPDPSARAKFANALAAADAAAEHLVAKVNTRLGKTT